MHWKFHLNRREIWFLTAFYHEIKVSTQLRGVIQKVLDFNQQKAATWIFVHLVADMWLNKRGKFHENRAETWLFPILQQQNFYILMSML